MKKANVWVGVCVKSFHPPPSFLMVELLKEVRQFSNYDKI